MEERDEFQDARGTLLFYKVDDNRLKGLYLDLSKLAYRNGSENLPSAVKDRSYTFKIGNTEFYNISQNSTEVIVSNDSSITVVTNSLNTEMVLPSVDDWVDVHEEAKGKDGWFFEHIRGKVKKVDSNGFLIQPTRRGTVSNEKLNPVFVPVYHSAYITRLFEDREKEEEEARLTTNNQKVSTSYRNEYFRRVYALAKRSYDSELARAKPDIPDFIEYATQENTPPEQFVPAPQKLGAAEKRGAWRLIDAKSELGKQLLQALPNKDIKPVESYLEKAPYILIANGEEEREGKQEEGEGKLLVVVSANKARDVQEFIDRNYPYILALLGKQTTNSKDPGHTSEKIGKYLFIQLS